MGEKAWVVGEGGGGNFEGRQGGADENFVTCRLLGYIVALSEVLCRLRSKTGLQILLDSFLNLSL